MTNNIDNKNNSDYNNIKMTLLKTIKSNSLELSKIYKNNLHIEIHVNPKVDSVKLNIQECNI